MLDEDAWGRLEALSDTFTCYSAAIATWAAAGREDWVELIDPGLELAIAPAGGGLLSFAHLRAGLRAELSLVRTGSEDPQRAEAQALDELERAGRLLVAGDGFNQPWHVAYQRRHAPHWFVLERRERELAVADPFAYTSELGQQRPHRGRIDGVPLADLLRAVPDGDPVLALREALAFGEESAPRPWQPYAWFVRGEVEDWRALQGACGPEAISTLATHFRDYGQELEAYRQSEDIWAIGRHRALTTRHLREVAAAGGQAALAEWVSDHLEPLAKRWGHVAPLMMQATLSLQAGRSASASLPETLDELASREEAATRAWPA